MKTEPLGATSFWALAVVAIGMHSNSIHAFLPNQRHHHHDQLALFLRKHRRAPLTSNSNPTLTFPLLPLSDHYQQQHSSLPDYYRQDDKYSVLVHVTAQDGSCTHAMAMPQDSYVRHETLGFCNHNDNMNNPLASWMESFSESTTIYALTQAGMVGSLTGFLVVLFKLAIEGVRSLCYEQDILTAHHHMLLPLIPALGGAVVGLLLMTGGPFAPGLKGTVEEFEQQKQEQVTKQILSFSGATVEDKENPLMEHLRIQSKVIRKSLGAIATLGTGCSLGPEGPCVEIGLNVARACTPLNPFRFRDTVDHSSEQDWNRILLSSGAAAGVAAGFNAPIAGVFFALEIMQKTFSSIDNEKGTTSTSTVKDSNSASSNVSNLMSLASPMTITPILFASVLSALVSQKLLGDHLVLTMTHIDLETPLMELPLYLILGSMSGVVAFLFRESSSVSKLMFSGNYGPNQIRHMMSSIPDAAKPMLGGLLCGLVGLMFPQILFFGYENISALLKNNALPAEMALTLLVAKTTMTAVSSGSGLVGGTFALALFLGAMLGSAFQNGVTEAAGAIINWNIIDHPYLDALTHGVMYHHQDVISQFQLAAIPSSLHIADVGAYAMVGAASVLSALFSAPLTACLLLFEVTRNYDAVLPLLASAGVASLVGDALQERFKQDKSTLDCRLG